MFVLEVLLQLGQSRSFYWFNRNEAVILQYSLFFEEHIKFL